MGEAFAKAFIQSFKRSRIGRRLVIATILFSSVITLATTFIQLYTDYHRDLKTIDEYFALIENSYIGSLSRSVWMYDNRQIAAQLDGLTKLPDMEYLAIDAGKGHHWSSGELRSSRTLTHTFPLFFQHQEQIFPIGVLKATASLDNVYRRLIGKALTILITNGVRAFFVSGFILLIFQFFVTRHLVELAHRVRSIDLSRPHKIELEAKSVCPEPDEIDQVVEAVNETQASLHQSYERLKNSEDELFRIFSMSIDLICVADINTATFIKVNPAFTETLGFSPEELAARPFLEFIHPDDIEPTRRVIDEQLKAGRKVINFENRYRCKNGGYRWLQWVSHPVPEKGVAYSVAHDVTAMKASVDRLAAAHERFLTVLDSIDAHIYVADMTTYEILFMNAKMKQDFGQDLTGRICWSVFRGEAAPCSHCTNDELVDTEGRPTDVCVWQGQNPITGKWYINYDRAIQWVDGRIVRIQIAMDITQMKAMETELRQAHKMEAVGTLAGGIAHEFNNLLGIIVGNSELALDDVPEPHPARASLAEIKTASLRARDVVGQLLSFSRKTEVEKKPVIVAPIVAESMQLLRASIPAVVEIRSHIAAKDAAIMADPTQIQQIIINLCTNAAHAMEERGGILEVRLAQTQLPAGPGRYVRLSVSDTGQGIAPEIIDRVFDPYFTTKGVGKGSGMGLSIVHGIVMNHDGAISIESEPETGTTVSIVFPICETAVHENADGEGAVIGGGSERILYVDDEAQIANTGRQILQRLGYSVTTQTSSEQALALFQARPGEFDLVITDMTMPDMTGDLLAAEIMKIRPDMPVILCTGYSKRMSGEAARKMGIKDFVRKPVGKADLARTVRRVLDEVKA